jgi:hypothetical protein
MREEAERKPAARPVGSRPEGGEHDIAAAPAEAREPGVTSPMSVAVTLGRNAVPRSLEVGRRASAF